VILISYFISLPEKVEITTKYRYRKCKIGHWSWRR